MADGHKARAGFGTNVLMLFGSFASWLGSLRYYIQVLEAKTFPVSTNLQSIVNKPGLFNKRLMCHRCISSTTNLYAFSCAAPIIKGGGGGGGGGAPAPLDLTLVL